MSDIPSRNKRELLPAFWRDSYEFYSVAGGVLVLVYYVYLYYQNLGEGATRYELYMSLIFPLAIIGAISYRLYGGIRMWFRRVRLYGGTLMFISHDQLMKIIQKKQGYLYLGEGYEWKSKHTQALYEMKKMDLDTIKPPAAAFKLYEILKGEKIRFIPQHEDRDKGATWLHGIEEKHKNIYTPISHYADHTIIPGTTGSGKTRLLELISTQFIHLKPKETLIAIDPKIDADWWRRMLYESGQAGREDDFLFFSLAHPAASIGINPIQNYKNPIDVANRLMAIIPKEKVGKLDGFQAFMLDLLTNIVAGMEIIDQRPTINNIFDVVERGVEVMLKEVILNYGHKQNILKLESLYQRKLQDVRNDEEGIFSRPHAGISDDVVAAVALYEDYIHPQAPSPEISALIANYRHDRTHLHKMIAPVKPFFRLLRSGDIGKLLSPDLAEADDERPWWDMSKIVKSQKILYIGTNSLSNTEVANAVASLLIADLTEVAADRYNYKYGGSHQITVFADESSAMMTPQFIEQLNKGRGAGIRIFIATQTIPDFVVRLGSDAAKDQVLGNVNQIICLRVRDEQTQKYVSTQIGESVLVTTQTSQSTTAISSDRNITNFQGSYGERTTETLVEAIPPADLGTIPNLEYIAIVSAGRVIKGKIPIIEKPKEGLPGLDDIPWLKRSREAA